MVFKGLEGTGLSCEVLGRFATSPLMFILKASLIAFLMIQMERIITKKKSWSPNVSLNIDFFAKIISDIGGVGYFLLDIHILYIYTGGGSGGSLIF